eukprot:m.175403 g.175403  ORF g.175403 m.175403 type:complete len:697 (-) comp15424_c0_seq1:928-3018(-)
MGIQGLLKFVEEATETVSLDKYKNKTLAVDASSWLHKGAYGCALELLRGDVQADSYVAYAMGLAYMMRAHQIKPILVFDGQKLLGKGLEDEVRRKNRAETRRIAECQLAAGDITGAEQTYQKCLSVTPEMSQQLIQACRDHGFEFMVAPYEADAQMAYLATHGLADAVVTEDSDLLAFGCEEVLFKLNSSGIARRVLLKDVFEKISVSKGKSSFTLKRWDIEKFRHMCILSGCDYLPKKGEGTHISGIGLKKGAALINKFGSAERMLTYYPRKEIPEGYAEAFKTANLIFLHQLCFCPREKQLVPLTPYPENFLVESLPEAGTMMPEDQALLLYEGKLNPATLQPIKSAIGLSKRTASKLENFRQHMQSLSKGNGSGPSAFLPMLEQETPSQGSQSRHGHGQVLKRLYYKDVPPKQKLPAKADFFAGHKTREPKHSESFELLDDFDDQAGEAVQITESHREEDDEDLVAFFAGTSNNGKQRAKPVARKREKGNPFAVSNDVIKVAVKNTAYGSSVVQMPTTANNTSGESTVIASIIAAAKHKPELQEVHPIKSTTENSHREADAKRKKEVTTSTKPEKPRKSTKETPSSSPRKTQRSTETNPTAPKSIRRKRTNEWLARNAATSSLPSPKKASPIQPTALQLQSPTKEVAVGDCSTQDEIKILSKEITPKRLNAIAELMRTAKKQIPHGKKKGKKT